MLLMTVPAGVSAAHAMPGMSARTETRLIQRAFIRLDGVPLLDGILLALKRSNQSLSLGERVVKPGEGEEASRPEGTSLSPAPPPEGEGSVVSRLRDFHDKYPVIVRYPTDCLYSMIGACARDGESKNSTLARLGAPRRTPVRGRCVVSAS